MDPSNAMTGELRVRPIVRTMQRAQNGVGYVICTRRVCHQFIIGLCALNNYQRTLAVLFLQICKKLIYLLTKF